MADIPRPSTVFVGEDAIHEMENAIFKYEMDTLASFVKVKGKKLLLPVRSKFMSGKIFWQEHSCQELPLSYDGVPFCICGGQVLECCYGPDRHRAEKSHAAQLRKADHDHVGQSRQLMQNTKKMDCPAAIHVRSVVRFPSYRIEHNSDCARRKQVKQLYADLRDMKKDVPWEHCIYITLPAQCTHKYHITNEIGALSHNVDKIVIAKIHGLVADGVRSVAEMKRHIFSFSKANFPGAPATSNRFYPNNKCLRNHMYAAMNMSQQYWQCESCREWLHPSCMGLDEPSKYICSGCQAVKIDIHVQMADIPRPSTCVFVGEDAIHEMENAIFKYEMDTLASFVNVKGKKLLLPVRSKFMSGKIFWQEHSCQELPLSYDGVPFCICGGQVLECCYGPDRHRAEKSHAAQLRKADHEHVGQSRQLMQNTKKMNCPAAIHVRSVVRFPSYRIEHNSDWARRKQVKQLHADLRDMKKDVPWEHCIYITLPAQCTHKYHITNEIGALSHNVDKIVIAKIHGFVADGVRSVAEMKRHIFSFSKANFPGVPATFNRFYPNNKCLRNHMYAAMNMSQQYWQCESCREWLHPSCMGLDEPSKYICSSCQLLHLPVETLHIILKEVVLADGDVAYGRLALVCSTFQQISSSQTFRNDCHLSWLLSIRPPSYWSRNAELYHTFSIVACISCGNLFKDEGPGFCGGNGKRGEFQAFFDEVENPGFCSVLCAHISGYTVCGNDAVMIIVCDDGDGDVIVCDNDDGDVIVCDNDVGDVIVCDNDVGDVIVCDNDVGDVIVCDNDVGDVIVCDNDGGDVIVCDNDVGDVIVCDNDDGD